MTSISNVDSILTGIGAPGDAKVTDPTLSGSEIALLKGLLYQLQNGGTSGTQYTDGAATVAHPIGTEIVYDKAGTMTALSVANPLPASAASLPLPTGAATEAGHLATIDTSTARIPAQGQAVMAASLPVVLASNQTAVPVLDTNSAAIKTDLDTIVTNTTSIATQATLLAAKNDLDTIVTNTNKIPASPATEGGNLATLVTNTTGIATAANQSTSNTSLSSITTNTSNSATVQGATTDAAVSSDANGTISAKLRGLVRIFADVWDSTNHLLASNVKQIGGQTPTLDNTTILATSMRVKTSVAGDTALTLGQATMANSLPVTVASNQSTLPANMAQIAGTTASVAAGTVDNGTQRTVQASAATGTKTSVASSASSVTILAGNTGRKGAMIYNDSAQILYLDLSGGTASSSSYSVQIPANGFFELPGPTLYNGAVTGIWASANGNARVTEFS